MKKMYSRFLVLIMALLLIASDGIAQKPILLIGRDNMGDYLSDQFIFDSLTAWGYAPTYANSGDFSIGLVAYDGFEGIVISESVDSKAMKTFGTTDDYPLPCVNMEGWAVSQKDERWAWVADADNELYQTPGDAGTVDDQIVVIKSNEHYITENYNLGDEVRWSNASLPADVQPNRATAIKEVNVTFSAKLGQSKAHADKPDFWNLMAINEMGASKNKMVYWAVHTVGLNGADQKQNLAEPAFFVLLKRIVDWTISDAGNETSVNGLSQENSFKLVAYPNPASTQLTIRFRSEGFVPATATLFNITGQQVAMIHKNAVQGNNFINLDAGRYAPGIYHIRLDIDGVSEYTKIVIR